MEDASEGIAAGGAHIVDDVGDDNVGYDEENEEVDELHGSDSVGSDSVGSDSVDFERNLVYSTSEDDSNVDELVYDEENPIMDYGVKYPDVTSFRSALNQFAIQNQFEYKVIKSDRCRVTARCRTEGCGWRIHAAQIQGIIADCSEGKSFKPQHLEHHSSNMRQFPIHNRVQLFSTLTQADC